MYCLPTFIDSITREFACKTHKERNLHDLKQIGMVSRMALMALCAQGHEEDWVSESLLAHVICVHSCFRFRSLITWRTYHCFFPSTKISVKTLSTCHATSTSGRIRRDHNMTCRNNDMQNISLQRENYSYRLHRCSEFRSARIESSEWAHKFRIGSRFVTCC